MTAESPLAPGAETSTVGLPRAGLPDRRFVFGRLALVALGALLGLGLADVVAGSLDTERDLRRTGALLIDEHLGWTNRPSIVFPNGKTRVNSLGLRGAELPTDASPTELRVLGVGASRTFGDLTDEDELVWSHRLQLQLRREDFDARVLNGGVNGYSALQAARRALALQPVLRPDLILIFIAPGSQVLLDSSSASSWVRVGDEIIPGDVVASLPEALAPLAARLHKLLLNSNLYARYRAQVQAEGARPAGLERFIYTDRPKPAEAEERLALTWAELRAFAETAGRAGVAVRAVLVPQGNQAHDPAWREWLLASAQAGGPPFDTKREEPTDALLAKLTELGLPTWDFSAEAERIGADEERFTVDGSHWTPAGHRVIASGLLQRLLAEPELLTGMTERRLSNPRD